ncbi:MAG TPA: 2-oxoglutarate dehydrogenase complex dihydrolipoyllysine-residue succinyltransferase [Ktedonosporobacter sp.]|jgi:2-oxoglutarate dehydrogenase E2 component (dihydrolipoamide succinyltransferase)|nr:2-oxoglutarate dehydrogenase complex dihydrolipoyllysine-residue succinyltransferase [Ktedonosporobacter sp.]
MSEIHVPTLGESVVEATVAAWRKQEGEPVHVGEALVELETDKVNLEVSAEQEGVLQKIVKQVGDVVVVGDVLGTIAEGAGAAEASSNGVAASSTGTEPMQTVTPEQQPASSQRSSAATESRAPSPLARRIAAENNIDLSEVRGTSPHGRITKEDVISYLQQQKQPTQPLSAPPTPPAPAPAAPPPLRSVAAPVTPPAGQPGREERIRMSRRRQTIAQRLVEAQHTAAMLTTFNEIDMSAVMEIRSRRKETFKERHQVSLGFMSFFTKAVVGALKAFPLLNAEIQGNEIVIKHYYDIGIAVSTEEGLIVPVLRDADRKSFAEIEREIASLAKRARENALSLPELQGGTFTITNGGVFGSLLSTPILNAPQVGILGMHKIEQRPIALNGQVVIRPMMYVALSYDHRIVDGSEAVQFLVKIKEMVEDPETLLLEG